MNWIKETFYCESFCTRKELAHPDTHAEAGCTEHESLTDIADALVLDGYLDLVSCLHSYHSTDDGADYNDEVA